MAGVCSPPNGYFVHLLHSKMLLVAFNENMQSFDLSSIQSKLGQCGQ